MKNLVFAAFLGLFAANAQAVVIGFEAINGAGNYSEDGFNFEATGGSTDGPDSLLWRNGGGSGNNDILVSAEGGGAFGATSVDLLPIFGNHLRIFDQDGNLLVGTGNQPGDLTVGTNPLTIDGVTELRLETNGEGVGIDNLELAAVPAPATVGLLLLGLMGVYRTHRAHGA